MKQKNCQYGFGKNFNNPTIFRTLLNLRDFVGDSLLHVACEEGNLEVAVALMDAGADVDEKNENEETALHLAASKGHLK
jgi:ankyrin repeat protein